LGEKTVLIVDDEFHIVNALALKFRSSNFRVVTAGNGREALQRIDDSKPDLVITDYQMPVMNGLDLVRTLRAARETREIPIIMLSARRQDLDEVSGGQTDVDAFMSKPFSPRAIVSQSRKLIGDAP